MKVSDKFCMCFESLYNHDFDDLTNFPCPQISALVPK